MSDLALHNARSSRMRLLVMPREHGAWGILIIPLLTGAIVGVREAGRGSVSVLFFAAFALVLFWLRTPVELLMGTTPMRVQTDSERRFVISTVTVLSSIVVLLLFVLFSDARNLGLVGLGSFVGLLFVLQSLLRRLGNRVRMTVQLVGALGLTSTAAGAYYVATGQMNARALLLWVLNWCFAANQIQYVQLRIHGAKLKTVVEKLSAGRAFLIAQVATNLFLVFACHFDLLPWLVLLAFVPVLLRGTLWFFLPPRPLRVHRLGFTELAHALSFGILLVLGLLIW